MNRCLFITLHFFSIMVPHGFSCGGSKEGIKKCAVKSCKQIKSGFYKNLKSKVDNSGDTKMKLKKRGNKIQPEYQELLKKKSRPAVTLQSRRTTKTTLMAKTTTTTATTTVLDCSETRERKLESDIAAWNATLVEDGQRLDASEQARFSYIETMFELDSANQRLDNHRKDCKKENKREGLSCGTSNLEKSKAATTCVSIPTCKIIKTKFYKNLENKISQLNQKLDQMPLTHVSYTTRAQRERLKRDRDKLVAQLNSLAFKAKAKRFKKFKDLRKERKKSKEGRR